MAGQQRLLHQLNMILQPRTCVAEQIFEDMAHGDDCRSGVHRPGCTWDCADLTACCGRPFQQSDPRAHACQRHRGGKASHASADDHDGWRIGKNTILHKVMLSLTVNI